MAFTAKDIGDYTARACSKPAQHAGRVLHLIAHQQLGHCCGVWHLPLMAKGRWWQGPPALSGHLWCPYCHSLVTGSFACPPSQPPAGLFIVAIFLPPLAVFIAVGGWRCQWLVAPREVAMLRTAEAHPLPALAASGAA